MWNMILEFLSREQAAAESKMCFSPMHKPSLIPRLPNGEKKEPGNIRGKHHLTLALPIRLQNETTFTRHFVHSAKRWQLENELVSTDYPSKVGEKQLSDVRKGCKFNKPKIKVHCSLFVRPAHSAYFIASSLLVKHASYHKLYWALLLSCCVFNEWGNYTHLNFFHTNFDLSKMRRHSSLYIINS